jgi:hypothetical protein
MPADGVAIHQQPLLKSGWHFNEEACPHTRFFFISKLHNDDMC